MDLFSLKGYHTSNVSAALHCRYANNSFRAVIYKMFRPSGPKSSISTVQYHVWGIQVSCSRNTLTSHCAFVNQLSKNPTALHWQDKNNYISKLYFLKYYVTLLGKFIFLTKKGIFNLCMKQNSELIITLRSRCI